MLCLSARKKVDSTHSIPHCILSRAKKRTTRHEMTMTAAGATENLDKKAAAPHDTDMVTAPEEPIMNSSVEKQAEIELEIRKHKDEGNQQFAAKRYPQAIASYRAGLEACSSSSCKELTSALRSNLAVSLLRVDMYEEAHEQCNLVLQLDPTNPKVWYRRGMAREGMARQQQDNPQKQQQSLLQQALEDLQTCLKYIAAVPETTSATKTMERAAHSAMDRVKRQLQAVNVTTNEAGMNGDRITAIDTSVTAVQETNGSHKPRNTTTSSMPSPRQQRQDVVRLLLSNKASLEGEALFLLDWNWWSHWCHYVDLFQSQQQQESSIQRQQVLLQLLPPGATLPNNTSSNNEEDETSSTSSSDSEYDTCHPQGPPGTIDNTALFVLPLLLKKSKKSSSLSRLKPNLVRGHHYEVIPREVYNALRIWYGEVTPSICRRVEFHTEVARLPLYTDFSHENVLVNGQVCAACRAPCASCRCTQCNQVYYCGRSCQESHWPYHKVLCKQQQQQLEDNPNVVGSISQGRVGLHNLGNTCFMNSALQCLSHAMPLTRHFLSNRFKQDVNTSNPLGTGGKLADAYESVLKELWLKTGIASTTPSELKRAISRFAPRFAGCSQHDAQEFLAYLLDGLHEDLNRIRKPPYVKKPEVGMDNMAIAGAKAWDAHQRRNDSLVMDTFYGQFKSTCVCPKCDRVSVSFDAFNHVALEIPPQQELDRVIPIVLFRAPDAGTTLPCRYGVTVKRGSFTVDLRRNLSQLCGIPPERLHLCDIYEHSIFEILKDNKPVSTIRVNDVLAAYEVPPYDDNTIHAVATHALVHENDDKRMDVSSELAASAELSSEEGSMEPFGFPFLSSFDSHSTCRQVWNRMWHTVTTTVAPEYFAKNEMDVETLKSMLRIRVVDNAGKSRPIFLDDIDMNNVLGVDEEVDHASILPPTSDEEVMKYLGKDCADRFLFLRLEWAANDDTSKVSREEKVEAPALLIQRDCFLRFEDHATLMDAMKKLREAQSNRGVTLDKCFETFTTPERLDEHNMWYCSRCKEHVRAMKTMELWRLPNILVVTLKRFEFKHVLRRDKLDTLVTFPLDGLDMSKHCASTQSEDNSFVQDNVPAEYDLFGVINHYGRMGFGHYTAFARRWDENGMSDDWALFDDSNVQSVGDGRGSGGRYGVVSPAAYVLFYRRRVFH